MAQSILANTAFERMRAAGPSGRSQTFIPSIITLAHRQPALRHVQANALGGPPPPPPPPPPPQRDYEERQRANMKFEELGFAEIKERYIRPYYLPGSFLLGALTLGLRTGAMNYVFAEDPLGYLGTAAVTGLLCMAMAWILFDFTDTPGGGNNFSGPR